MKSKLTVELIGRSFERIMSGTRRKYPTYLEISKDLGISVKTIHNFIEKNKGNFDIVYDHPPGFGEGKVSRNVIKVIYLYDKDEYYRNKSTREDEVDEETKPHFELGQKVYDTIFFNGKKLTIVDINEKLNILVVEEEKYKILRQYTLSGYLFEVGEDGSIHNITDIPTLSIEPYTLEGFK